MPAADAPGGPLTGIRVLDLSRVLAGPYCTALLADAGADVIKVEPPDRGDDARSLGPFRNGESIYFATLNRSKRSVTVNLRTKSGAQVFRDLVRHADVIVENYRPGVTRRLGVAYEDVLPLNSRLVYASISGYGQDGPASSRPAYDLTIQAASGLMAITGFPDGPATRVGESLADLWSGLLAAWSITTALFERERTGRGRHLDVAMFDALVALQVTALSQYQVSGQPPTRVGNRHPVSTPFDSFPCADGTIVIAVANEPIFERLAKVIGHPHLSSDERFATDDARTANEPALRGLIEQWTGRHTVAEAVRLLDAAGVPASPIHDLGQALGSEQSAHRRLLSTFQHPRAGRVEVVQQPVRFDGWRDTDPRRSPDLGEHTDGVLGDLLGYGEGDIARLRRERAI